MIVSKREPVTPISMSQTYLNAWVNPPGGVNVNVMVGDFTYRNGMIACKLINKLSAPTLVLTSDSVKYDRRSLKTNYNDY